MSNTGLFIQICLYYSQLIEYLTGSVALELIKIVASMYKPFSVKAVGSLVFPPFIEVANCDQNGSHFSWVSSIRYLDNVPNLSQTRAFRL